MQDVSKIVTERLRAAVQVANHPDADVLTAFSERLLPEGERAVVLEHLALCGDCREILVLAQPAAEATQILVRPASRGWLSWPALRWGFVAVGVFAIASLGVIEYRRHTPVPVPSMAYSSRQEAAPKPAQNQVPPPPAAPQSPSDQDTAKAASASARAAVPASATARKAVGGASARPTQGPSQHPHGPRVLYQNVLGQNSQQNAYRIPTDNDRVPSGDPGTAPPAYAKQAPNAWTDAGSIASGQTVVAPSEQKAQLETQGRNPETLRLESQNIQPTEGGQGYSVERAKEPGVAMGTGQSKVLVSSPEPPDGFTGSSSQPNASWAIANGSLERSVDQGKSWQSVNVNAVPAPAANSFLEVLAGAADGKKDTGLKQEAVPPVFRAVRANGSDVWAGGSRALLCHSVDSGAHWIRILPSSGGATLTGDIVSVDFPDSQHGRITTSTPEVWLTSDGGQTWQKQ
jgi:hypothetical protein